MSLKIHMLEDHLDIFSANFAEISDEHGEKFHQKIQSMETNCERKLTINMLSDCCWSEEVHFNGSDYSRNAKGEKGA